MSPSWRKYIKTGVHHPNELAGHIRIDVPSLEKVCDIYPMRINAYFLDLMKKRGASLMRQVVPDPRELEDATGWVDPLAEERNSSVPNLVHRYPDRVLFLVSNQCGVYCRFCTRKRKIGRWDPIQDQAIEEGFRYIRQHGEIFDVLLSGGDPLLLSDEKLDWILMKIKEISHVGVVRIGTRIPSVLPQRVTSRLANILSKTKNLYINLHFNHPDEITDEVKRAIRLLSDRGIPLGSQTVLLKGINDHVSVISRLMRMLLQIRVKPYYLLHADLVKGTEHFRTTVDTGLFIMRQLRGHMSGLAVPTYVVDLPGGGGKVPLLPGYVIKKTANELVIQNYQGYVYRVPNLPFSTTMGEFQEKAFIEN
ncbi:KamA family radical SAM protein [bacterium]|nr:KamA family radical SAM protein [bacterium]RQV94305.1 MAG: KamA family radical SAM protein [bacterium]